MTIRLRVSAAQRARITYAASTTKQGAKGEIVPTIVPASAVGGDICYGNRGGREEVTRWGDANMAMMHDGVEQEKCVRGM